MPKPGMAWRHVIISTHNSWLPGDPRGFRSEDHEIHSSGDYKNPPPVGEHEGLRNYNRKRCGDPVVIPKHCREKAGRAMIAKLKKLGFRLLAMSVAATHAHALVELPDDVKEIRHIVGQCKTKSSHAIRDVLPGQVWAGGGGWKRVDTQKYQRQVYNYILRQKDAWIWSYKDEIAEGSNPRGSKTRPEA
jgi:REP element-mobilizing transposase RayT